MGVYYSSHSIGDFRTLPSPLPTGESEYLFQAPEMSVRPLTTISTESFKKYTSPPLSDENILDIMTNPSAFTQYSDKIAIFNEILLPLLSKDLRYADKTSLYTISISEMNEVQRKAYKARLDDFFSSYSQPEDIKPQEVKIDSPGDGEKVSSMSFPDLIEYLFDNSSGISNEFLRNSNGSSNISRAIIQRVAKEANSYLAYAACTWAISHGSVELLIASALSFFQDPSNLPRAAVFPPTPEIDQADFAFDPASQKGVIIHPNIQYSADSHSSLLAFGNKSILLIDSSSSFVSISTSEDVTKRSSRIKSFKLPCQKNMPYIAATIDRFIIFSGNSAFIGSFEPFSFPEKPNVEFSKSAKFPVPPLSSDGKYIYSLTAPEEVSTFELVDTGFVLVSSVLLTAKKERLLKPFNKFIIPKEWQTKSVIFSNGSVLQFIALESEMDGRFLHISRSFRASDGSHICDRKFTLNFPIQSMTFDTISNSLWTFSAFEDSAALVRFDNVGSYATWLTGINYDRMVKLEDGFEMLRKGSCVSTQLFLPLISVIGYRPLFEFGTSSKNPQYSKPQSIEPKFLIDSLETLMSQIGCLNPEPHDCIFACQVLIVILSEQLKSTHISVDQLFLIATKACSIPSLAAPLFFLFLDNFENLFSKDNISHFFTYILPILTPIRIQLLLNRYSASPLIPFLFSPATFRSYICIIISKLKNKGVTEDEFHFLREYGRSLFYHLADNLLMNYAIWFTEKVIDEMGLFMNSLTHSYNEESFQSNQIVRLFSEFLAFVCLPSLEGFASFVILKLFPLLQRMLYIFQNSFKSPFWSSDTAFSSLYSIIIATYNTILTFIGLRLKEGNESQASSGNEIIKLTADALKNPRLHEDPSSTAQTVLSGVNPQALMDFIYKAVSNPLNKRVTPSDMLLEYSLLIAISKSLGLISELNSISASLSEKATLSASLRQIVQSIYKIRTDIRSAKQSSPDSVARLIETLNRKSSILLSSSLSIQGPFESSIKEISQFLSPSFDLQSFLKKVEALSLAQKSISIFFTLAKTAISNAPPPLIPSICSALFSPSMRVLQLTGRFNASLELISNSASDFLNCLIKYLPFSHPSPSISLCLIIIEIMDKCQPSSLISTFSSVAKAVIGLDPIAPLFRSLFSLICFHFSSMESFKTNAKSEEFSKFAAFLSGSIPSSLTSSPTIAASIISIGFCNSISISDYSMILPVVLPEDLHSFILLLINLLKGSDPSEDVFQPFLDIIGSILCGCSDSIFCSLPSSKSLSFANLLPRVNTATIQMNAALELIYYFRSILISSGPSQRRLQDSILLLFNRISAEEKRPTKHAIAYLAVMTNTFEVMRPNAFIIDNGLCTYSLECYPNAYSGIQIPIYSESSIETFRYESSATVTSIVPFSPAMFPHFACLIPLIYRSIVENPKTYADCLLSFIALSCLKEYISDQTSGIEYVAEFLSIFHKLNINDFEFRDVSGTLVSMVKQLLSTPSEGIFSGSPSQPVFLPASFNKFPDSSEFTLTQSSLSVTENSRVFVSSVLDTLHSSFLSVKIGRKNDFVCGLIVHSSDVCHCSSILLNEGSVLFDGKLIGNVKMPIGDTFELKFNPKRLKVSASSSSKNAKLFSSKLKGTLCSFIIIAFKGCTMEYHLSLNPSAPYFKREVTPSLIFSPSVFIKRLSQSAPATVEADGSEKYSMLSEINEQNKKDRCIFIQEDCINSLKHNPFKNNKISSLKKVIGFASIKFDDSPLPIQFSQPISFVKSQSQSSSKFLQINEIDGSVSICSDIAPTSEISSFHFSSFSLLPPQVLNCLFSGVWRTNKKEALTLLVSQGFCSEQIGYFISFFEISSDVAVKFLISSLIMLETFNFSFLGGSKLPIDFENDCLNKECKDDSLYGLLSACRALLNYEMGSPERCNNFLTSWANILSESFISCEPQFFSRSHPNAIVFSSNSCKNWRLFSLNEAIGFIIFPIGFCFVQIPTFESIPKMTSTPGNYGFISGNSILIKMDMEGGQFGLIPILPKSNETLLDTFFELAVSFKYFVLTLSNHRINGKFVDTIKSVIRKSVALSIVAGSPFFYSHGPWILQFMDKHLPLLQNEINPEYYQFINILSIALKTFENKELSSIKDFLLGKLSDASSCVCRDYFPELTGSDKPHTKSVSIPESIISPEMEDSQQTRTALLHYSRLLLPVVNIEEYPFNLLLPEWISYFAKYPLTIISNQAPNIISITFLSYKPRRFKLASNLSPKTIYYSVTPDFKKTSKYSITSQIPAESNTIYLKFDIEISSAKFVVFSNDDGDSEKIITEFRNQFIEDAHGLALRWNSDDDQRILASLGENEFTQQKISLSIDPSKILKLDTNKPAYILALRIQALTGLNWICFKYPQIMNEITFADFRPFVSIQELKRRFMEDIKAHNGNQRGSLSINRVTGLNVREGISTNYSNSMIAQFAFQYTDVEKFRDPIIPFKVSFVGESGIDKGGLAREFASELVHDINEPRIGLFIQTPNARNAIGSNRECIIPSPDPRLRNHMSLYRSVGALVAMSLRTGLVQPFEFPPLFWKYLAGEELSAESIYEVDENFNKAMKSLMESVHSGISVKQFTETYNLKGTVINARGAEISIGGDSISLSQCERFVGQCIEYRVTELRKPMQAIKDGFWENLGFAQPSYVTAGLLQSMSCGERVLEVEMLKNATSFSGISSEQIAMFWKVIEGMTNEQRRKVLQFATGTMSIPSSAKGSFLKVDRVSGPPDSKLPSASTCTCRLHLPEYSSAEKMMKAIVTAYEYTGTFEKW